MVGMDAKPRCYIASPLGFADSGRLYYESALLPALSELIEPVDPWMLATDEEFQEALRSGRTGPFAAEVARRNIGALRNSELLVAVLDGQEVDSGTAAEVGFAAGLSLPCFGLRTDRRDSGEPGATVNLQVEGFIALTGGRVAGSLDALLADLRDHLRTRGGTPAPGHDGAPRGPQTGGSAASSVSTAA